MGELSNPKCKLRCSRALGSASSARALIAVLAAMTVLVVAPVAWAVGWVNVGPANVKLNEEPGWYVHTFSPVYSSQMRLYVATHQPCGGYNFWMEYDYPDGHLFGYSTTREICFAYETPSVWDQSGGNKYALCLEEAPEPADPVSTCQRYSTT